MAGLTDQGLTIRTQSELQAQTEEELSAALPGINLRAGFYQQAVGILSEQLAEGWEALQALYASLGEDAGGVALDQRAALTGTTRRQATYSRVTATVNLDAGKTLAAGAKAAVSGNPDAEFASIADATNSSGAAADVAVIFDAVTSGPMSAPAGTLTVIVTPVTGWNSITNAADADLGKDIATDAELRQQRIDELAGSGSGTLASIKAAVAKVTGVEEVDALENTGLTTDADGLPGKSFRITLWDGSPTAAADDDIAQAIWDHKPAGILADGSSSGSATDDDGDPVTVAFDRATILSGVVVATVVLEAGTAAGWEASAKQAVSDRAALYRVAETAYADDLGCALRALDFIRAVPAITINGGASLVPTSSQIVRVDTTDVTVGT